MTARAPGSQMASVPSVAGPPRASGARGGVSLHLILLPAVHHVRHTQELLPRLPESWRLNQTTPWLVRGERSWGTIARSCGYHHKLRYHAERMMQRVFCFLEPSMTAELVGPDSWEMGTIANARPKRGWVASPASPWAACCCRKNTMHAMHWERGETSAGPRSPGSGGREGELPPIDPGLRGQHSPLRGQVKCVSDRSTTGGRRAGVGRRTQGMLHNPTCPKGGQRPPLIYAAWGTRALHPCHRPPRDLHSRGVR